jgi:hypothetical protein
MKQMYALHQRRGSVFADFLQLTALMAATSSMSALWTVSFSLSDRSILGRVDSCENVAEKSYDLFVNFVHERVKA